MHRKIVMWGATGQAKVLWELFEHTFDEVIALFENNHEIIELSPFKKAPIYYGKNGFLEWKSVARPDRNQIYGLAALGGSRGKDRVELQEFMQANNILPITAVHPTAFVARDARIGESCQILAHATICAETSVGNSCIVNSSATIEHECKLAVGVHIGPGAKLAGLVQVDEFSFIGTGAIILPRVNIGKNVIVGAGAVVTKNIADNLTVVGNPARPFANIQNVKEALS
jgi:sugar O-acyltransferase (sialic acid O-acetyltransferase NeuD family)